MSIERAAGKAALKAAVENEEDEGCNCQFNEKTWPNILAGMGIGAGGCAIAAGILNLMVLPTPNLFLLELYIILFGILAVAAEARRFKIMRSLMYKIVKHVYFITNYTARSVYYVFLGTIIFDPDKLGMMIFAIYIAVTGFLLFTINVVYKLPEILDKEELKKRAEERMRREIEEKYIAEQRAKEAAGRAYGQAQQAVSTPNQTMLAAAEKYPPPAPAPQQDSNQAYGSRYEEDYTPPSRQQQDDDLEREYYSRQQHADTEPSRPAENTSWTAGGYGTGSSGQPSGGGGSAATEDPFGSRDHGAPYRPPHLS